MKKTFFIIILLFQLFYVFGQSIGTIVKNKTIYNMSGITVLYTITYEGVYDCNDTPDQGVKKYRIDFYAKNISNSTVKLAGSRIDLDDNLGSQHYCRSGIYILFGSYPGFENFGTLIPNENVNATKYVYMLQNTNELPFVTYSIFPIVLPNTQGQNGSQGQSSSGTSSNNPQNNIFSLALQEAFAEYNKLLRDVTNSKSRGDIYNDTQRILNGNYSEQGKLNALNDAIYKFKILIKQGKLETLNSNNFEDLQRRQLELVKQIRAIEPNANVWIYEGNIGENLTLSIQRSKDNIYYLETYLEKIKSK